MINERVLILDVYIFDESGKIATVFRGDDDIYVTNVISPIILTLPLGNHPIKFLKQYLIDKKLDLIKIVQLPAFYQNTFDSEPECEYLVISYKIVVKSYSTLVIDGDPENKTIKWLTMSEFKSNPQLIPEFRSGDFENLLKGVPKYYSGHYQDSDGSNKVLQFEEYNYSPKSNP